MTIKALFPTIRPTLNLDFANSKVLGPRVTFTRASTGTFVGSNGLIQAAASGVPRFDHNPTTGESLGLLVEEARTNGIRNNTMVGAVAGTPGTNPNLWAYVTTQSNGLAVSVVGTGVENGINYIDYRFNGTTVASPGAITFAIDTTTAATAQTWTNSLHWKLAAGTATGVTVWQIGIIETTAGGSFVTGANYTQTAPSSAALITQRPAATRTLSGGVTVGGVQMTLVIAVSGNTAIDFTIRIGLPQMEQGAFATSAIPTTSATVTRAADVATITGTNFSSWYNQTEGTVFVDVNTAPVANIAQALFDLSEGVGSERMFQRRNTGGQIVTAITDNGVVQGDFGSVSVSASGRARSGFAYRLNDFEAAVNGSPNGTDTSATVPTPDRMHIGQNFGSGQVVNGTIKRLTYWPTRLSNPTLQAITQP